MDAYDLVVLPWVRTKLRERGISLTEVEEALFDAHENVFEETRSQHRTKPPTYFCFGESAEGRLLKVVFILIHERKEIVLKTAYEPEEWEIPNDESNRR